MTPAERKRAERQRRKEAGEVRVECWVSARDSDLLRTTALVMAGKAERAACPGKWRVFRDGPGRVVIEDFEKGAE